MNLTMQITMRLAVLLIISILAIGCNDDDKIDMDGQSEGRLQVAITDAPVDDPNVEAVFITTVAIELDGNVHAFDQPKTIEISSLTEGKTEILIEKDIAANSYSNVSLILDYESNAENSAPGCYVLTTDGVKHNLKLTSNSSSKLTISNSELNVLANNTNKTVIDFDLRKALRYNENSTDDKYDFSASLSQSLRLVTSNSLTLAGSVKDDLGYSKDKVVVYAYAKGTFNQETEMMGNSDTQFSGAVTSTVVKSDGTFELHFLEKGEYEIQLVNYEEDDSGKLRSHSILSTSLTSMLNLTVLNLESNTDISLLVIGIIEI